MKLQNYKKDFFHYLQFELYLKEHTLLQYRSNIKSFIAFLGDREFNLVNSKEFIEYLLKDHKRSTVGGYLILIRTLCNFFIKKGILDSNFGMRIPMPRRDKPVHTTFTVDEINRMLAATNKIKRGRSNYWWLYFSLLSRLGARQMEIANLLVSDLDLDKNTVAIRQTKTSIPREVPIPDDLIEPLRKYIKTLNSIYLFPASRSGKPPCASAIREQLIKLADIAGISKRTYCHAFRHSFITLGLSNNLSLSKTQRIVGHKSLQVTAGYTHLITKDLTDTINNHPLSGKPQITVEERLTRIEEILSKLLQKQA